MKGSIFLAMSAGTLLLACEVRTRYATVTVWEDADETAGTSINVAPSETALSSTITTVEATFGPTTSSVQTSVSSPVESSSPLAAEQAPPATTEALIPSVAPSPATTESTEVVTPIPTTLATVVKSTTAAAAATTAVTGTSTGTDLGSAVVSGEATFYGGNLAGGTCSFTTYTLPSGMFGTAFSGSAWDNAANCGACVEVTGPNGNSITAMVVDECPECDGSHLDLFQNAFEELGAISAGIISISYKFVECGITSPIVLHNKSGTSQYFFAMQVVNSNVPVASLEVSTDGGSTWQSTTRADYNFFQNDSGFGTDTVDIRVTSSSGATIVVNDVGVSSDSQVTASSNF